MPILTAESSSVAICGGGFGLPIGMQSMQNTLFLLLFETNFRTKSKNIPPIGISNENVTTLTLDLKRIRSQNSIPTRTKTFFWSSPNFGQKTGPNPSEGFLHLILGKKRSDSKYKLFKFGFTPLNTPSHCQFLARHLAKSRPCECSLRVIPSSFQAKRIIMIVNIIQKKAHRTIQFS